MQAVTIHLPDSLYAELAEVAAAIEEPGYTAQRWAEDLVSSELAARRLPKISQGRNGPRIKDGAEDIEPSGYRVSFAAFD
jgi:hypothetical protein